MRVATVTAVRHLSVATVTTIPAVTPTRVRTVLRCTRLAEIPQRCRALLRREVAAVRAPTAVLAVTSVRRHPNVATVRAPTRVLPVTPTPSAALPVRTVLRCTRLAEISQRCRALLRREVTAVRAPTGALAVTAVRHLSVATVRAPTRVLPVTALPVRTVDRRSCLAEVPQGCCPLLAGEVAAVPTLPVRRLRRSCSGRTVVAAVPTLPVRHEPVAAGLAPATPIRRMTTRAACLGEIAQGRCPLLRAEVSTMGSHCLFPPRVGLVFRGPFAATVCRRGRSRWFLGRNGRLIAPLLPVASMRLPSRDGGANVPPRRCDLRGRGVRSHACAHATRKRRTSRARDLAGAI